MIEFDAEKGIYRSGDLAVSTRLTENLIGRAYYKLEDDKILDTVYYERLPSISGHLKWLCAPESIVLGAFADRSKSKLPNKPKGFEFCGMSWVVGREILGNEMTKAEVGFTFFRHTTTPAEKVALGKMMLEAFFSTYCIDVLIGTTPECNKLALEFSKALGFELNGPIKNYCSWEGYLEPVVVSTLTKADWKEHQRDEAFLGPRSNALDGLKIGVA